MPQGHWYTRDLDHTKKCMKSEESMDGYWEPGGDTFTFEGTTHACREVSQGFARSESQNVNIKCQDMQICHGGFSLLEIVEVEKLDSISWWSCKFQFPSEKFAMKEERSGSWQLAVESMKSEKHEKGEHEK